MTDFLLELLSEEIPARMQGKASQQLARLFSDQLATAGLAAQSIETYATPRRLALIARGLPTETAAVREETKGPRTAAPPQALEGFLRKTGLTRDQLVERDGVYFAVLDKPGRATASVLAEAIPAIVRAFPWPKSMRWGAASASTESLRWVRPLQGIVALFGEEIVECEIAGIRSGAATVGHRFHHPGIITIGSAADYVEKLHACHVILDPAERRRIIAEGAAAAARDAGLTLVEDQGLLEENAGLTEWPVPLLGSFDPEFLQVPPEVIQLTMRTNQKYFACTDAGGALAPNFICTANIEAADGGTAIVEGNRKVLAARLSDARFFWEQDLKVKLEDQAQKLTQIVFHEKLGTVADKVDRVAKLARWLVEEGIVGGKEAQTAATPTRHSRESGNPAPTSELDSRFRGNDGEGIVGARAGSSSTPGTPTRHSRESGNPAPTAELDSRFRGNDGVDASSSRAHLAALAERAARLCKADLVTQMVGEFPELQGLIGGYLARAQGEPDEVADAIRDHYKPVGQGDEVPTAPVTVAVSLADKLDSLTGFFFEQMPPTGTRDPFALRRSALGVLQLIQQNQLRFSIGEVVALHTGQVAAGVVGRLRRMKVEEAIRALEELWGPMSEADADDFRANEAEELGRPEFAERLLEDRGRPAIGAILNFFADRLKVQQREAGVRHDLIDAVFAANNQDVGGEDDLVRLLARVRALQAFVETPEGADLLAGYKRAANILKKEGWGKAQVDEPNSVRPERSRGAESSEVETLSSSSAAGEGLADARQRSSTSLGPNGGEAAEQPRNISLSYRPEKEETALIAALESAEPRARAAVEAEDFEGAMAALASLRAPVDAFFDKVTVNDPDPAKRAARLDLLARMRAAVHRVADFSKIEG
ncbi:MAG TPA: glycine--tRNA ligase subunit beta [Allosphingosinicella sp.]|jgi:glycyl-tRNA synthetase beta chain